MKKEEKIFDFEKAANSAFRKEAKSLGFEVTRIEMAPIGISVDFRPLDTKHAEHVELYMNSFVGARGFLMLEKARRACLDEMLILRDKSVESQTMPAFLYPLTQMNFVYYSVPKLPRTNLAL